MTFSFGDRELSEDEKRQHAARLDRFRAFAACFEGPEGARVLEDLDAFCRTNDRLDARDDAGRVDPYSAMVLEGRRQVVLHIRRRLVEPKAPHADRPGAGEESA